MTCSLLTQTRISTMAINRTKNICILAFTTSSKFSARPFIPSTLTSMSPGALQAPQKIPRCAQRCLNSSQCCVEPPMTSCLSSQPRLMLQVFLIFIHLVSGTLSIHVQGIRVPQPGVVGRPAILECVFDADQDNFYSTRWYLNGEQFYSFIKRNNPEKVNHNHTDVNVELDHSDKRKVTISEITAAAEGQYKCEVMGEAPHFETDFETQNLTVVRLPDDPEILGIRSSYKVGDILEVTCTARHSWPSSRLSFTVNRERVPPESGRVQSLGVSEEKGNSYFPKGSYTSTSKLILPLDRRFSSSLRLGCHAHVQSLEKTSFATVEVDSGISSMFSFFNAGVAGWTSNIILISVTLTMPLLLLNDL